MKIFRYIPIFYLLVSNSLQGQERYTVERVSFSSDKYDEFSPVIIGKRLVFCSNQQDGLFITYVNKERKGLFKIFSVQLNDSGSYSKAEVFSRNLFTPYNDGPIAFDSSGRKAIYSRNIDIETKTKDLIGRNDNLGLFLTELADEKWTNIKPFKYNNESYSNTTPFLSPDGKYLYFASDRPGGFGGSDLYRCKYIDSSWMEPENLGKVINTSGNEVSPFINYAGELFFASDGHPGLGKKDLFMSTEIPNGWIAPVHLDPPINSPYDDFSLITDSTFTSGYFASDRNKSDDIFRFKMKIPLLYNCDTLKENQYCFQFWDEKYPGADSLPVEYEWQFSDGAVLKGLSVEHCFAGAGKYWAKLNIVDNATSSTFFTQTSMEFDIKDFEQPYITSKDTTGVLEEIKFSGLKSNLPGFIIEDYIWDFGDGDFITGSDVSHSFKKEGAYNVKLGLKGTRDNNKSRKTYCVFKPIRIISVK
jgi:PKD domain/WD40-like Beta Propeller Repeat